MFLLFANQSVSVLTGVTAESSMQPDVLVAIGFLIAMIRSPRWLDKFVYNTGVGDMAKRGSSTAGTFAIREIMRLRK